MRKKKKTTRKFLRYLELYEENAKKYIPSIDFTKLEFKDLYQKLKILKTMTHPYARYKIYKQVEEEFYEPLL